MANKQTYPVLCRDREIHEVNISWAPNGSSAVSSTRGSGIRGRGFSVARTGVGVFQITIDDNYPEYAIVGFQMSFQLNAAAQYTGVLTGSANLSSSRVITVTVLDSTPAAADIAANANNRIFVKLTLANASVGV